MACSLRARCGRRNRAAGTDRCAGGGVPACAQRGRSPRVRDRDGRSRPARA